VHLAISEVATDVIVYRTFQLCRYNTSLSIHREGTHNHKFANSICSKCYWNVVIMARAGKAFVLIMHVLTTLCSNVCGRCRCQCLVRDVYCRPFQPRIQVRATATQSSLGFILPFHVDDTIILTTILKSSRRISNTDVIKLCLLFPCWFTREKRQNCSIIHYLTGCFAFNLWAESV
jgi:hypothetical protein